MRITPLDVRKQEFRRAVRGFDCEEVRAFLTTLADEYETVLIDNKQLRERVVELDQKIKEYKHLERTLRDTLMTAERLTQDTRERANKEGDLIIQDARLQARRVLEECRVRTEELRGELTGLRKEKETYLARFKILAETQIQFVESHRNDFDDLDKRLVGMVDEVIEGLGAKAATRAEEAVTRPQSPPPPAVPSAGRPTWDAPSAPATAAESVAAAPLPEVDQWRNYEPQVGEGENAAAPAPTAPAPAAEVPAADPVPAPEESPAVPEKAAADPAAPSAEAYAPPTPAATTEVVRPEVIRPEVVAAPVPPPAPAAANPWLSDSWRGDDEPAKTAAPAASVAVELATLGIPLAGAPRADDTERAVESLAEEPQAETTPMW